MKTKLTDLNTHLFEQLERLNDQDLKGEELEAEIKRAKSMTEIGGIIIESAKTTVEALKIVGKGGIEINDLPPLLTGNKQLPGDVK